MILKGFFIIIGLMSLLMFLGLPVYLYLRYRRSKKAWKHIKRYFDFEEESSYRLKGNCQGETFTIAYHPGRRYQPASISIILESSFDDMPTGTLRAERWWDKLGKAMGLVREYQSWSDKFDHSVYVGSNDERFQPLIRNSTFRRLVTSLMKTRHSRVRISQGYYSGDVEWKSKAHVGFWNQISKRSYLEEILSSLVDLKDHLATLELPEKSATQPIEEYPEPSTPTKWIGYGLPIVSVFVGVILFFWGTYYPTFTTRLHVTGLKIAGVILLGYLPFGYLCFRGGSQAHKKFFGFSACALFGLPLFMIGLLTTANGFLDNSSLEWRQGQPVDLHYDEGDYFVRIQCSYNGVQGRPELEISEGMYDRLNNRNRKALKNPVSIQIKEGYFSEPWVENIKLEQ